jgi:menaquinone-dependent protoporphyrinogen IX oxidase
MSGRVRAAVSINVEAMEQRVAPSAIGTVPRLRGGLVEIGQLEGHASHLHQFRGVIVGDQHPQSHRTASSSNLTSAYHTALQSSSQAFDSVSSFFKSIVHKL